VIEPCDQGNALTIVDIEQVTPGKVHYNLLLAGIVVFNVDAWMHVFEMDVLNVPELETERRHHNAVNDFTFATHILERGLKSSIVAPQDGKIGLEVDLSFVIIETPSTLGAELLAHCA
jgi:hypothetical protein